MSALKPCWYGSGGLQQLKPCWYGSGTLQQLKPFCTVFADSTASHVYELLVTLLAEDVCDDRALYHAPP